MQHSSSAPGDSEPEELHMEAYASFIDEAQQNTARQLGNCNSNNCRRNNNNNHNNNNNGTVCNSALVTGYALDIC